MKFLYFEAPEIEMADLLEIEDYCSICGNKATVFRCEFNEIIDGKEEIRKGVGCFSCLEQGKFGFFHITEVGDIDKEGLNPSFDEEEEIRIFIADSKGEVNEASIQNPLISKRQTIPHTSIAELRKTPSFSGWQETEWKVHCNDFMAYLGYWQPIDFVKHSKDGDGKKLFLEIADEEFNELWDSDEVIEKGWNGGYIMFRCLHCNKLRGTFDFS